jgi:hypothetical protein
MRGFEWAGLKIVVEVPEGIDPNADWHLSGGFAASLIDAREADVRVSLQAQTGASIVDEGVVYFHEGDVFEAGRLGSDHWIRLADDGRIALADASFRWVEIVMPTPTHAASFPLAHPLDDLIVIHRALEKGAFALRATAAVRDGRALVILGDAPADSPPRDTAVWQGWLLLQPRDAGIVVAPLPSAVRAGRVGSSGSSCRGAWLDGLHVLDPMTGDDDVARVLDSDVAAGELVRYAFSPISAPHDMDRVIETATQLADRVPVLQLQLGTRSSRRFAWRPDLGCQALPAGA